MKPRRKQPERTRQAILEAAGAEFTRQGYAGAGLGAIVERAELTKGALFHHFSDKRTMAVAWIGDHLGLQMNERWIQPMEGIGSLEELRSFLRSRCMEMGVLDCAPALVAMTAERAHTDAELGEALERVWAAWRGALAALVERGKNEGWIHRSIQPAAEAAFVVSALAGFTVACRANDSEGIRRNCATALEGYLETLRAQ
jgi:TetR/AcrR family transcriptional regulator, transcriptional repressor for nem operon